MRGLGKIWWLLCGGLLISASVEAQSVQCTQRLEQAQAQFDLGSLTEIPQLLLPCIQSRSFSTEENVRAHKLITLVYLYQDDQEKADLWMRNLLKADPEHKLDPEVDPQEIIFLKEKFRYKPIFRGSVSFLPNYTLYHQGTAYPLGQPGDVSSWKGGIGFNFYAQVEREVFTEGFDVGAGLGYVTRKFELTNTLLFDSADVSSTVTSTESQTWYELPLFAKYTFYGNGERPLNPYVLAGVTVGYLAKADKSARREEPSKVVNLDMDLLALEKRRTFNYYAFAGAGIKYRVKTDFLFLEMKYAYGIRNMVNSANRMKGESAEIFDLANIDSDFYLDGIITSVGFQWSFYKPDKIRE